LHYPPGNYTSMPLYPPLAHTHFLRKYFAAWERLDILCFLLSCRLLSESSGDEDQEAQRLEEHNLQKGPPHA